MQRLRSAFAGLVAALAPTVLAAQATVTLDQVEGAQTAAEFLALGARQVGAAEFDQAVVGRLMDEGGWTWVINADGTHASQAKDGSWTDGGGTWEFVDNQYCRESPGNPRACSNVYLIGDYLRMDDPATGELAGWTVQVQ